MLCLASLLVFPTSGKIDMLFLLWPKVTLVQKLREEKSLHRENWFLTLKIAYKKLEKQRPLPPPTIWKIILDIENSLQKLFKNYPPMAGKINFVHRKLATKIREIYPPPHCRKTMYWQKEEGSIPRGIRPPPSLPEIMAMSIFCLYKKYDTLFLLARVA